MRKSRRLSQKVAAAEKAAAAAKTKNTSQHDRVPKIEPKDEPEKSSEPDPQLEPKIDNSPKKKKSTKKYICDVCEKIFQGLNDLRKHSRIHNDERPYACSQCDKKFRQAGCLKNHIASQHGSDVQYICDYCNKPFPIKERLRLHLRIHTGEKPYKCKLCPKQFARGGQLSQHMLSHNGVKKHRCSFCPSAFSCSANLRLHTKAHNDERDYTCHKCGKSFLRPDALNKHLSCLHGNVKAFLCPICKKMFKGHLPQHMRIHKNLKPHGCADCGTAFTQRSQLVVHQRIHSGERPYRCQVCWQAFAHSSVLKLHIRKHTGEKPFKCPLCVEQETAFSQLPHLKKHMQAIHKQDKPYMCESCNQFFRTKIELTQHNSECTKQEDAEVNGGGESDTEGMIETPMALSRMRLLVAVLIKKISSDERLKTLGFEKRLIDNVLIDSLKFGKRTVCEDATKSEAERLKINIRELLEWTVPQHFMEKFKSEQKSTEELLEELAS
ncbi:zinc finger protein 569-like [Phlebotomus papatasi]|uniref:C2H2-type domain-containing protein n=2 Tax=Phlebotomus papatasi TaxID=29031 RepID=A0A1B0CZ22_PHLPP|nr:zinc finger protein 569-like [Phlebotomus papatasi]XP_055703923.1 zinc finger protein 569-like [Phlebotomus papatasi]XP_055703924.1 zinc finger protein 569-like [Phlebotomus papatasi]XP_055703925.1 zinc finger protein 569-like [Phlebotomus papatasi]XP_055703926.1 zinc finger protein 569-like [Phlebotomus papatasi]XP_055703927.1 zinc finger protein 569-like [Phlebotomus papatasi]XP_055703928.1 zinc finger protein 569-like [Phlebotomus papatasi]XP_055703929.1 zinc finger protein 569-like [P